MSICPLRSNGEKVECTEKCEWYDDKNEECILKTLTRETKTI